MQATCCGAVCTTVGGVWRKGIRTREAVWPNRAASTLRWRLTSEEYKEAKAYAPKLKLYSFVDPTNPTQVQHTTMSLIHCKVSHCKVRHKPMN